MNLDAFLKVFGKKIKAIRKSKGISQERLAELSGLHPTYISDVERGEVNASIYNCYKITNALGISISNLISPQSGKSNEEIENEINILYGLIRELGRKEQKIILSALRGMLSAIKKI